MSKEKTFVALHAVTYDHPSKGRIFVKPGQSLKLTDAKTIRELLAVKAIRADDGLGDEDLPPLEDDELDEQADDEQLDEEEEDSLEDALDDLQTEPPVGETDDGLGEAPAKKAVAKTAAKKSTSNKK